MREIIPKWPWFRLVNYYSVPIYIYIYTYIWIWMEFVDGSSLNIIFIMYIHLSTLPHSQAHALQLWRWVALWHLGLQDWTKRARQQALVTRGIQGLCMLQGRKWNDVASVGTLHVWTSWLDHVSLILWRSLKSGQQFKVSLQEASQLPKRAIVENLQKVLHRWPCRFLLNTFKYRLHLWIVGIEWNPEVKEQHWFAPFPLQKHLGSGTSRHPGASTVWTEVAALICLDPSWTARREAAPREILIQHRLLGKMKKTLKAKTHEQVMEAREYCTELTFSFGPLGYLHRSGMSVSLYRYRIIIRHWKCSTTTLLDGNRSG